MHCWGWKRSAWPLQAVVTYTGTSWTSLGSRLDSGRVPYQVWSHWRHEYTTRKCCVSPRHSWRGQAAHTGQDEGHDQLIGAYWLYLSGLAARNAVLLVVFISRNLNKMYTQDVLSNSCTCCSWCFVMERVKNRSILTEHTSTNIKSSRVLWCHDGATEVAWQIVSVTEGASYPELESGA